MDETAILFTKWGAKMALFMQKKDSQNLRWKEMIITSLFGLIISHMESRWIVKKIKE